MKKVIAFQCVLLFFSYKVMADQTLPVFSKKTIEKAFAAAEKEMNIVCSNVRSYMPVVKNEPTFLKTLESYIYLFEKNVENVWSSSIEGASKICAEVSEFVSEASKNPAILQEQAQHFYDQGSLFIDRHPTFCRVAGVVGFLAVSSYIRKKIVRKKNS